MDRDPDNVEQSSRLPVRAASLPLKCAAGKDALRTASQELDRSSPYLGSIDSPGLVPSPID